MDERVVAGLCRDLCADAGLGTPTRQPIQVWRLSGVERLQLPGGAAAVFKYASEPFTTEDRVLRLVAERGVPVPALYASAVCDRTLGMVMEDLGDPTRDATDDDAASAAARLHAVRRTAVLATLGEGELRSLPSRALIHLGQLREANRFTGAEDVVNMLKALSQAAPARAVGAELAPFGLCHSELHPTSLHVGETGWRLLDFAKAFIGPGLLDLATWQGTRNAPDPARLRQMMDAYVAAGGDRNVLATRGGLPAEAWALGWHRIWAVAWFIEQAARGNNGTETDAEYMPVIRRQLIAATKILAP
jgi:hypothetical protein